MELSVELLNEVSEAGDVVLQCNGLHTDLQRLKMVFHS